MRKLTERDYDLAELLRMEADSIARTKNWRAEIALVRFNPWTDQAETYIRLIPNSDTEAPNDPSSDHTD